MQNYITDDAGTLIYCRGLQVRPTRSTGKITSKLLDGSFTVQQISTNEATTLQVTVGVISKATFDAACASCEPLYIYHFDKRYHAIITSQEISWEPVATGNDNYRGTFEAAAIEVVDR